jgi:hypothetical protein
VIKKTVREIETGEGVLIFDDTLQEKPHSKENDLICWHYDHCVNRSVRKKPSDWVMTDRIIN